MSKQGASRRALAMALAVSATLGATGVVATLLLPDIALLFVGGDEFADVKGDLWKFAIVGTLLAMLQLLVYSALARRQGRAVLIIWTALIVLVTVAVSLTAATTLVMLVVAVDGVLLAALLGMALSSGNQRTGASGRGQTSSPRST